MTRQRKFLFGAMATLLVGLLAIYLAGKLEPYEEVIKYGPAPEARADVYLAAVHFLQARNMQATRADDLRALDTLPATGQSLLLLGDRSRVTPRQVEQLLDWTSRGGHLLFVAEGLWDEDLQESGDLLLDRLDVQQYEVDEDAESQQEPLQQPHPELTKLHLPGETAPAYLDFDTAYHLYDPQQQAHLWANSAHATHLLQLEHGRGLVTVVTDSDLWTNRRISEFDHAWLLWYLTRGTDVTVVGGADHPSLATLLARHFPQALAALALLMSLALWRAAQRQGPLLPAPAHARRQLQAHVRSLADFHLRHDGTAGLIARLQEEIGQRARYRHPGFPELATDDQHRVLSHLSLLPIAQINQAMQTPAPKLSLTDFTRQVAHLQTLRNAL